MKPAPDHDRGEIVFRVNRGAVLIALLAMIALFALVAWRMSWPVDPRIESSPLWIWTERSIVVVFALVAAWLLQRVLRLLFLPCGVTVTEEGIVDHTAFLEMIPWANVESCESGRVVGVKTIVLRLRDQDSFLAQLGPISRTLWERYFEKEGPRHQIFLPFLRDAGRLESVLRSRVADDSREPQLPNSSS